MTGGRARAVDAVDRGIVAGCVVRRGHGCQAGRARGARVPAPGHSQLHGGMPAAVTVKSAGRADARHRIGSAVPSGGARQHLACGDHRIGQPRRIGDIAAVKDRDYLEGAIVHLARAVTVDGIAVVAVELAAQDPPAQPAERLAHRRTMSIRGKRGCVEVGQEGRVLCPVARRWVEICPVANCGADRAEVKPCDGSSWRAADRGGRDVGRAYPCRQNRTGRCPPASIPRPGRSAEATARR